MLRVLGIFCGSLSVVKLVQLGFDAGGLTAPLELILDYYEKLTRALLEWTEPFLRNILVQLNSLFSFQFTLSEHWRHVFVLMGIYFARDAKTSFTAGFPATGIFRIILGLLVALLASVATGLVPFARDDFTSQFLIAAIPEIAALLIYDLVDLAWFATFLKGRARSADVDQMSTPAFWPDLKKGFLSILRQIAIALALAAGLLNLPPIWNTRSPGLLALFIIMIFWGFYQLWWGVKELYARPTREQGWWKEYWRSGNARLGADIIYTFLAALAFFILNAGLQLVGL